MRNFQIALEANGLFDIGWKWSKFTWSNRYKDESFTKERLDKAIANQGWIENFGQ